MKTALEILQCAQDLLATLGNLSDGQGSEWTAANFQCLQNFAKEQNRGLSSFYKRKGQNEEFLWDFIASSPETGIFLAAESEQNADSAGSIQALKHDFEKLLYVYAPIRVLITKARTREKAQETVDTLRAYSKECSLHFNPGSVFIVHFVLWNNGGNLSYLFQSRGDPDPLESEDLSFTLAQ